MGKLEDMLRGAGSNVGESMGEGRNANAVHRAPSASFAGMPLRLQGITKSKEAAEIPLEKIQADQEQPREEFDDAALARLADSLRARGQLQPIRLRWDEGRGLYVILCGERRWRAAAKAGLKTMTCVIHDAPLSSGELLAIQMVENCVREDLKPIEQAKAFRSLMAANGWTVRQVAGELAIDHSSVVRALALLDLPAAVQEQVEHGRLAAATAYEVSKLDDTGAQAELAARVVSEGLSRAETAAAVHRAPGRASKAKAKGRRLTSRVVRLPTGKVTIELRKGEGLSALRALLADAMASLDAESHGQDAA